MLVLVLDVTYLKNFKNKIWQDPQHCLIGTLVPTYYTEYLIRSGMAIEEPIQNKTLNPYSTKEGGQKGPSKFKQFNKQIWTCNTPPPSNLFINS